ncbi:craniofacial development protein 2-like [Neoarius graeffei]|uniref:craniofacial development protein 2-like n=1 Tax=Neoarius graeffei TaxID=443677 RepID=UPI00298C3B79|nr:craniofacial development protein 2-like [Neoarius graeffei]
MNSPNSTNPILPAPGVGRNLAAVVGAGFPVGRGNDDGPLNPPGRGSFDSSTNSKALLRCRRPFTMATFNVCTIKADSKARELAYCAGTLGIGILGVQEHCICHQSPLEFRNIEDHHLITSAAWRNEAQASVGGVGLLLSREAKNALCNVRSYSCRVLSAVFAGNPATTFIVAYSPTNVSDESDVKEFYDNLRVAIYDTPAHNFLAVLGDFNARLGQEDVRFPFHESTNRNSQHLADLLVENNLLAANTCFQKRPGKRWTFQDRGTKAKCQLDYLLVRKKWRNSILNAEAYNSFSSLGSDHRVVGMKVRLSLRVPKRHTKQSTGVNSSQSSVFLGPVEDQVEHRGLSESCIAWNHKYLVEGAVDLRS